MLLATFSEKLTRWQSGVGLDKEGGIMLSTSLQKHHCIATKRKVPVLVVRAGGYGKNTPATLGGGMRYLNAIQQRAVRVLTAHTTQL